MPIAVSSPNSTDISKIIIGRFGAPFGVKGWLHIVVFNDEVDSFLQNSQWSCAAGESWKSMKVEDIRANSGGVKAKLQGVDDRTAAEQWTNKDIALERGELPSLAEDDEYYWQDLIGLQALGVDGEILGEVCGMMRTGAHDILRIAATTDAKAEILVPYVEAHVVQVDMSAKTIRLHWQQDW